MYILSLTLLKVMAERSCQACWTTQKEQASGHSLKKNPERRTLNCGARHSSTLHCQFKLPLALIYDILRKIRESFYAPPLNIKTSKYATVTIQEGTNNVTVTSTASRFIPDKNPRQLIPDILIDPGQTLTYGRNWHMMETDGGLEMLW